MGAEMSSEQSAWQPTAEQQHAILLCLAPLAGFAFMTLLILVAQLCSRKSGVHACPPTWKKSSHPSRPSSTPKDIFQEPGSREESDGLQERTVSLLDTQVPQGLTRRHDNDRQLRVLNPPRFSTKSPCRPATAGASRASLQEPNRVHGVGSKESGIKPCVPRRHALIIDPKTREAIHHRSNGTTRRNHSDTQLCKHEELG